MRHEASLYMRTPVEDTDHNTDVREATEVVEIALKRIRSEEDAERVLDEIERRTAGRTEVDVETTPSGTPASLKRQVRKADKAEKPVVALEAAVEQTSGEQTAESEALSAAVQEAMSRPDDGLLEAHTYLRRAVLRRMTPLQAVDTALYVSVNRLQYGPFVTRLMRGASTIAWHGAGWAAGALALAVVEPSRGRSAAREMLPALLVTNTLVERVIKKYFRRRRPFITIVQAMVVGRKPGSWSFPSGHSATSFACASALSARYPWRRPILYSLASLVAFSRVYLGHHYPMDVVSGATIGEGLSRMVVWVLHRMRR